LALGDSVSFGYSQEMFNEFFPKESPPKFETELGEGTYGFIEPAGRPNGFVVDYNNKQIEKQTETSVWKKAINNGCPGETSDSFIGNGPVGTALEAILGTTGEAPCAYHNVNGLRLHHEYASASQSQLENALEVLAKENPSGKHNHPVVTISVQIGSNDLLREVHRCEAQVKEEFETTGKSIFGATPEEAVKGCLEANAGKVFQHILKNVAGILFALRNGSLFGSVNYTGKIIVGGYYNPYGAVFTPGVELLPSSNTLEAILNFFEGKLTKEFGGCYANPQPRFNPLFEGKPAEEPARLQAFTNMANFTFAKEGNKEKNGPDIHPTPLGYEELANINLAVCG
jgi:hypothetical protein